jgi:hypothetical protein
LPVKLIVTVINYNFDKSTLKVFKYLFCSVTVLVFSYIFSPMCNSLNILETLKRASFFDKFCIKQECKELDDFLQTQKKGNSSSRGIDDEIKLIGKDGKEKKCYTQVPGQFGW